MDNNFNSNNQFEPEKPFTEKTDRAAACACF